MGSRRCCSCSTASPERCDFCCADCISQHKIEDRFGNSTFNNIASNDVFLLHQGCDVGNITVDKGFTTAVDPIAKLEYVHIGSFWTFWHPAYMVNFDPFFPSCSYMAGINNTLTGSGQVTETYSFEEFKGGGFGPGSFIGLGKLPKNKIVLSNLEEDQLSRSKYYAQHYGKSIFNLGPSTFDIISEYDPYSSYNGFEYPGGYNVFTSNVSAVGFKQGGAFTMRFGYPCSTPEEDKCCEFHSQSPPVPACGGLQGGLDGCITGGQGFPYLYSPYSNVGLANPTNVSACNYLGLTKYRRRMLRTYYPWAWQIFSYNQDYLIPFGEVFKRRVYGEGGLGDNGAVLNPNTNIFQNKFEDTGSIPYTLSSASKTRAKTTGNSYSATIASTLRQQFLGFAFCEHHFDSVCGCRRYSDNYWPGPFLGTATPKRFIYSCSGIPIFEFELYTAAEDGLISQSDRDDLIEIWRLGFSLWNQNPDNRLEAYYTPTTNAYQGLNMFGATDYRNYPTKNQAESGKAILKNLRDSNYEGIIVKDWREEAYDEIIEANQIYRDAIIRMFILENFVIMDNEEEAADLVEAAIEESKRFDLGSILFNKPIDQFKEKKAEWLPLIFPKQLGPIRKKFNQISFATRNRSQAQATEFYWDSFSNCTIGEFSGINQGVKGKKGPNVLTPIFLGIKNESRKLNKGPGPAVLNEEGSLRVDTTVDGSAYPGTILIEDLYDIQAIKWAQINIIIKNASFGSDINVQFPDSDKTFDIASENEDIWFREHYGPSYSESDIYDDIVNRISHLCHTYFLAQPGGWDFFARGPLPDNERKPENYWWFRRYSQVQYDILGGVSSEYFGIEIPKHSQLSGCGSNLVTNWDYAWNPLRYPLDRTYMDNI